MRPPEKDTKTLYWDINMEISSRIKDGKIRKSNFACHQTHTKVIPPKEGSNIFKLSGEAEKLTDVQIKTLYKGDDEALNRPTDKFYLTFSVILDAGEKIVMSGSCEPKEYGDVKSRVSISHDFVVPMEMNDVPFDISCVLTRRDGSCSQYVLRFGEDIKFIEKKISIRESERSPKREDKQEDKPKK